MGVTTLIFQTRYRANALTPIHFRFGLPYLAISVSLNFLLTLMIITRLTLQRRNVHTALGASRGIYGLYKIVTTILIESSALYAVSSLLVLGVSSAIYSSFVMERPSLAIVDTFLPILAQTQVSAFPPRRASDRQSNVTMDRTGHRFIAHRSTSRQPERVDGGQYRHRTCKFAELQDPRSRDYDQIPSR